MKQLFLLKKIFSQPDGQTVSSNQFKVATSVSATTCKLTFFLALGPSYKVALHVFAFKSVSI